MIPSFQDLNEQDQRHTLAFFFAFDAMYQAEQDQDSEAARFWIQICDSISANYPHVVDDAEKVCALLANRLSRKSV